MFSGEVLCRQPLLAVDCQGRNITEYSCVRNETGNGYMAGVGKTFPSPKLAN